MKQKPDISIITINYNRFEDTCELISSLKGHCSVPHEIIVIDNGSAEDRSLNFIERYPDIKCIRSEKNLGFSGGNNLGIKEARGTYLFFLNNDTYILEDSFRNLIERLEQNPRIGGVSPKIKFAFPPQNIQFAGYTCLSSITLRNHLIGFGEADHGQHELSRQSPYLHGAAMMIKREVINKVGVMPEIFFLYYEELDWCTRMTQAGYELWYEPQATVFHKESQTTGQESPLRTFYLTRNRLLYAWRNRKHMICLLAIFYQLCVVFPKDILMHCAKGKFQLAKATFKGGVSFIILKNKMVC